MGDAAGAPSCKAATVRLSLHAHLSVLAPSFRLNEAVIGRLAMPMVVARNRMVRLPTPGRGRAPRCLAA